MLKILLGHGIIAFLLFHMKISTVRTRCRSVCLNSLLCRKHPVRCLTQNELSAQLSDADVCCNQGNLALYLIVKGHSIRIITFSSSTIKLSPSIFHTGWSLCHLVFIVPLNLATRMRFEAAIAMSRSTWFSPTAREFPVTPPPNTSPRWPKRSSSSLLVDFIFDMEIKHLHEKHNVNYSENDIVFTKRASENRLLSRKRPA